MLQNPIDILSGRVVGPDIGHRSRVQVAWALALLGARAGHAARRPPPAGGAGWLTRPAERLRPYRALLASRARAQLQYRASFVTDILGTVGVGLTEFAEVWVIFHNVDVARRARLHGGPARLRPVQPRFSLADMFVGHLDQLPRYIRAGTLDVFYLRPLPLLAQLITSDLSLRRIGRLSRRARRAHRGAADGGHRLVGRPPSRSSS